MSNIIPADILHETSGVVSRRLGWDYPENRLNDLERGILAMARESGIKDSREAIIQWLSDITWDSAELNSLATFLTVGETYFFREKAGLDIFRKHIIPGLINQRRDKDQYLRIWSAGCCSGEEPYTLAILLSELIPDIENWNITILASDINSNFLKKAKEGIYTPWSFRETSQLIKCQYFKNSGKNFEINPVIREMVTFDQFNLAEEVYPSEATNTLDMDVIFCRNVLMYFTPDQLRLVTKRLHASLTESGWLITSAVELNDNFFHDFTATPFDQGIFYQKRSEQREISFPPVARENIQRHINPGKSAPRRYTEQIKNAPPNTGHFRSPGKVHAENYSTIESVQHLFDEGRYSLCIEKCQPLLTINHLATKSLTLIVKCYANLGKLREAHHWGKLLLQQDGIDAAAYYLVANILVESNEYELAQSTLKKALYLDPHHVLSHFLLGNILYRQDKKNLALKHFRNVRELLATFEKNEMVPGSDGLTAGRMIEFTERT